MKNDYNNIKPITTIHHGLINIEKSFILKIEDTISCFPPPMTVETSLSNKSAVALCYLHPADSRPAVCCWHPDMSRWPQHPSLVISPATRLFLSTWNMAAGEIGQRGGYGCYTDDDENSNNQALSAVMTQSFILLELCVSTYVCTSVYWFTFHFHNLQKTIS